MNRLFYKNEYIAKGNWQEKKCQWCGKYLNKGDKFVVLILDDELKAKYKKLKSRYVIHSDEFNLIMDKCNNDKELILMVLDGHITPRVKFNSEIIDSEIERAFMQTAKEFGLNIETRTKSHLKYRAPKSSLQISLNLFTGGITTNIRGRINFIDRLYLSDFDRMVSDRVNDILGINNQSKLTTVDSIINTSIERIKSILDN